MERYVRLYNLIEQLPIGRLREVEKFVALITDEEIEKESWEYKVVDYFTSELEKAGWIVEEFIPDRSGNFYRIKRKKI